MRAHHDARRRRRGILALARSVFRRFLFRDERGGAAMVEFALVAGLIFIPLFFGIMEFGRLVWSKTMITAAAREGVRYSIVRGSRSGATADSAAIATYVIGRTQLSPIDVKPSWTGSKDPGDTATVEVTYTYVPFFLVFPTKVITSTSKQIIAF